MKELLTFLQILENADGGWVDFADEHLRFYLETPISLVTIDELRELIPIVPVIGVEDDQIIYIQWDLVDLEELDGWHGDEP